MTHFEQVAAVVTVVVVATLPFAFSLHIVYKSWWKTRVCDLWEITNYISCSIIRIIYIYIILYIIYYISHIIYYIYVCSWLVGASEPWLLSPDTAPHLGGLLLTFWRCLVSPISNHGALWKNIEAQ